METPEGDIDSLKQEVEELRAITEDTNRQVHKMRRGARWGFVFQIVWWLTVAGITGAAYYYYVQPYVQKIENLYLGAQHANTQTQNYIGQFQQWFSQIPQYFSGSTTTTQ